MSVPKIGKGNMISLKIVSRFCLKASCTHNSPHTTHTQKHFDLIYELLAADTQRKKSVIITWLRFGSYQLDEYILF